MFRGVKCWGITENKSGNRRKGKKDRWINC